jgi:hypothetical protein
MENTRAIGEEICGELLTKQAMRKKVLYTNATSHLLSFFLSRMEGGGLESNCVHSARRPPTGLLYFPRLIMSIENTVE